MFSCLTNNPPYLELANSLTCEWLEARSQPDMVLFDLVSYFFCPPLPPTLASHDCLGWSLPPQVLVFQGTLGTGALQLRIYLSIFSAVPIFLPHRAYSSHVKDTRRSSHSTVSCFCAPTHALLLPGMPFLGPFLPSKLFTFQISVHVLLLLMEFP